MTTQQDERAELIRELNFAADNNLMLPPACAEAFRKAAALLQADAKGGEAVALHEKVKWGAQTYGPLLRAAIDLLAAVDARHEETGTLKYTIPYGAVNALRDALTAHPQPQAVAQGWKPIETAPKDGTVILVTDTFTYRSDPEKKPHHVYRAVRWNEESYGWEIYNDGEIIDQDGPTFWMPLPAEPGAMLSASPAAPAAAHDDAALQALGWQRISCPVCGADGARAAPQQAAQEIEQLIRERDDRDEIIDRLCDAVLGEDRHEWSSAYGFDDAVADVEERINQLHQPSVDRAWTRFEQAHSQPAAQVAQPLTDGDLVEHLAATGNLPGADYGSFRMGYCFALEYHGIGKDQG